MADFFRDNTASLRKKRNSCLRLKVLTLQRDIQEARGGIICVVFCFGVRVFQFEQFLIEGISGFGGFMVLFWAGLRKKKKKKKIEKMEVR